MRRASTRHYVGLLLSVAVLLIAACFGSRDQIVFVSKVDGDPEVVMLDPENGEITQLTNNSGRDFSPSWSPDRKRVAYLTDQSGSVEINLVNETDRSTTRLTDYGSEVQSVLWSPDSQRLAFVSSHEGNPEIYVMGAEGMDLTRLTFNSAEDHLGDWSPDGEWLVFHSEGSGADSGMWLRNPTGVNLIHLTRGNDSDPVWSPDNQRIAFVRTQEDNQDIYIAEKPSDGTWRDEIKEVRLTQGSTREGSSVWSPDGKFLAFVSFRDGSAEIYSMRADGSQQERLTRNGADDLSPVWSPDGKRIAFVSNLYGAGEIFIMDTDGGRQRRLTNNSAEDSDPDW
jgi:Tol biopolymer transport system component